jgi:hypothetical protein
MGSHSDRLPCLLPHVTAQRSTLHARVHHLPHTCIARLRPGTGDAASLSLLDTALPGALAAAAAAAARACAAAAAAAVARSQSYTDDDLHGICGRQEWLMERALHCSFIKHLQRRLHRIACASAAVRP